MTPPGKGDRPDCKCHGEPMLWQIHHRYTADGYWYCRVRHRERVSEHYYSMSGVAYNRRLLLDRRRRALKRRAERRAA